MKNKSVPGYKRVFAWMIAVFAMVIPWISYLRIWKLTDAQADVFENYNGYVFDFFLYYREVLPAGEFGRKSDGRPCKYCKKHFKREQISGRR